MHKLPQKLYLELFSKESAEEVALTTAKNTDYANDGNAFQNFNVIEYITDGQTSTEIGILTRLCDKFQRVASLLTRPEGTHKVKDEAITDTLRDISVYAKILRIYIMTKELNYNIVNVDIIERSRVKEPESSFEIKSDVLHPLKNCSADRGF